MAPMAVDMVVRQLRVAALRQDVGSLTDGELVQAFVSRREEAAFEALVRRHGTMVLNVCRRVLHNEADAEDAFQATFLVLVRKAAAIRSPSAVSSWLYGVAHTTALKAKAMNSKRRARELEAGTLPRGEACEEVWRAVQALLDAELACLPEKYRIAIVQCDLECKTIKEAARLLDCPQGTIATRLARGRALLARRLAKHGLIVSAAALTAAISHGAMAAGVPPALVVSTVKATSLFAAGQAATSIVSAKVAALTQGVVQAMFLAKLKSFAVGLVVLTVLGAGVGVMGPGIAAQDVAPPAGAAQQPLPAGKAIQAAGGDASLKKEVERLRAELEKTRRELEQARLENAELRAQAQLAEAQALVAEAQAKAALRKAQLEAAKAKLQLPQLPGKLPTVPKLTPPLPKVPSAAVSPDGRSVATAEDRTIIVIDAQTGKVLFKAIGHTAPLTSLAFSPDGKVLATAAQDKTIMLWDPLTGKQIRTSGVPNSASSIRFSGDARIIIIVESDRTQREFDAATGKEIRVIRPEKAKRP